MKYISLLLLLVLVKTFNCFAQQSSPYKDSLIKNTSGNPGLRRQAKPYTGPVPYSTGAGYRQPGKLFKDTAGLPPNSPHYIIKLNDQTIPYSAWSTLSLIGPEQIFDMNIYSGKKADSLYAGSGEKGLIIIRIKKHLPMYTRADFFKKYHIKKKYDTLPVYIDSAIAYHTEKFMFSETVIKSITIAKDKETGSKFINILTTFPYLKYSPNEINIRGLTSAKDTITLNHPLTLYTVEGKKDTTEMDWPHFVQNRQIKSKGIIKNDRSARYGEKAKNGIVLYIYTKDTQLLNMSQLLKKFGIDEKYKEVNMIVDGNGFNQTHDKTIFTLAEVKNVILSINKQTGEKFINITTNDGFEKFIKDCAEYMTKMDYQR